MRLRPALAIPEVPPVLWALVQPWKRRWRLAELLQRTANARVVVAPRRCTAPAHTVLSSRAQAPRTWEAGAAAVMALLPVRPDSFTAPPMVAEHERTRCVRDDEGLPHVCRRGEQAQSARATPSTAVTYMACALNAYLYCPF
ncbi:hypothetical protein B0H13DRAFT_1867969 [Mycena leptocephala]|nr:hypothetical protein B0H13DRAFT_1867969 [Mycena leptocephala]